LTAAPLTVSSFDSSVTNRDPPKLFLGPLGRAFF
jgi:hypothetical protein